jgi:mono/diheme cytochrome c family protein
MNISVRTCLLTLALGAGWLPASVAAAPAVHQAEVAQADMQQRLDAGRRGYENYCQSCHAPTGIGMAGVFPPLAGADYLLEDKARSVDIVLAGRSGPIVVNGQTFDAVMPNLAYLDDEQVSQILSYVRNAWGNDGGYVSASSLPAGHWPKVVPTPASRRHSCSTKAAPPARWGRPR